MELSTIDDLLHRDPFEPLRLTLSNGQHVDIHNPSRVVPMKRDIFIANPERDGFHIYSMLHVVGVESLSNGSGKR